MSTIRARHRTRPVPWKKVRTLGKAVTWLLVAAAAFGVLALAALVTSLGMLFGLAGVVSGLL